MTTNFTDKIETARCFPTNKSRATGTLSTCGELVHVAGMEFLTQLHSEIEETKKEPSGDIPWIIQQIGSRERREYRETAEAGLTSEINSKVESFSITETIDRVTAILTRHPFGYQHGLNRTEDAGWKSALAETLEEEEREKKKLAALEKKAAEREAKKAAKLAKKEQRHVKKTAVVVIDPAAIVRSIRKPSWA